MQGMVEMPRYVSHKTVWALKIAEFSMDMKAGTITITPAEPGYAPFEVSREYVEKHRPHAGGYFVVYADGYQSFSPMKAFVEGYKRLEDKGIVEGEARLIDAEVTA